MNQSNITEKRQRIVKQLYLHDSNINIIINNTTRLLDYKNYSYMKTQIGSEVLLHVVNVCNNTKTCECSKCIHCYLFSSIHVLTSQQTED